jgi:spore coat polysaccharide biosynthesis protein SpsF
MRIGAVILSRLDSKRLPGKALLQVAGQPLIHYVFSACRSAAGVSDVVLATSARSTDERLAEHADVEGARCFRGPTDDVAARFLGAMQAFGFDAALRVNGDSPLAQSRLLARGVALFAEGSADLVTNVPGRTFPFGLSVEVVARDAMNSAYPRMDAGHREHVTKYFYDAPSEFRVRCFEAEDRRFHGLQLAVDTPLDLERFAWIVEQLGPTAVTDAGVVRLAELAQAFAQRHPGPAGP